MKIDKEKTKRENMPFEKKDKLGKGGARSGAAQPPPEKAPFGARLKDALEKELGRRAPELAKRYIDQALKSDEVFMHLRALCLSRKLEIPIDPRAAREKAPRVVKP